jgi:hypothetical protein
LTNNPAELAAVKRRLIDFDHIDRRHAVIHERLLNWAIWCRGSGRTPPSPMFRQYRSSDARSGHETSLSVDSLDAHKIEKAVVALPAPHRMSLQWWYVYPVSVSRACRWVATTKDGLYLLCQDARQMLLNRRV